MFDDFYSNVYKGLKCVILIKGRRKLIKNIK